MKWTIAGVGALLFVAGAYALVTGLSIIQVERGWAMFIAGAVLLGSGAVVLGLSALLARIDRLIAVSGASAVRRLRESPAGADAQAMDRLQHVLHDVPPPPREVTVEALPTLESLMPQPEPAPAPPPAVEPQRPREPAPDPRPSGLRDFEFVFPAAEMAAQAAAAAALRGPVEPVQPLETGRGARRAGGGWFRRTKPTEPPPREMAPPLRPEPPVMETPVEDIRFDEPVAEPPAPAPAPEPEIEAYEPEPELTETSEQVWTEAEAEIVPVPETAPEPEPQPALDPFSNDWLERALAGDDESVETSRFATPAARRAAAEAGQTPADGATEATSGEGDFGRPAPVEIGRYRANDVAYVMFSDGSIVAETPAGGTYRFTSLLELRAFIERGGA